MNRPMQFVAQSHSKVSRRRGIAAILAALMLVFMLGVAALAVDIGYLYMNYGQLQSCADSGALAGASGLLNPNLFNGTPEAPNGQVGQSAARSSAIAFAQSNRVSEAYPVVDSNVSNDSGGDVVIGYLSDPSNPSCTMDFSNPSLYNAVQVRVRKTSSLNGPVTSFFARALGSSGTDLAAKATAVLSSSVVGFQVTSETGNAGLLPFAVSQTAWDSLMAGNGSDLYEYSPSAGTVSSGGDGVLEMSMFPISNGASGNFGTMDIGNPNNSTADLERQILSGANATDLAYFGGSLRLGANGTLLLNGDTGISAAVKDELDAIKGKPRIIPLYSTVSGPGNNATYTIVGFVGVRIMNVKLTGNPKYVTIQPAVVVDDSAILGSTSNQSQYVYSDVRLVR